MKPVAIPSLSPASQILFSTFRGIIQMGDCLIALCKVYHPTGKPAPLEGSFSLARQMLRFFSHLLASVCVRSVLALIEQPPHPHPHTSILLTRESALPEWGYWFKPQLPSCKLYKIGAGHLVLIHTPTRGGRSQHSWVLQWGLHRIKVKENLNEDHEGFSEFGKRDKLGNSLHLYWGQCEYRFFFFFFCWEIGIRRCC